MNASKMVPSYIFMDPCATTRQRVFFAEAPLKNPTGTCEAPTWPTSVRTSGVAFTSPSLAVHDPDGDVHVKLGGDLYVLHESPPAVSCRVSATRMSIVQVMDSSSAVMVRAGEDEFFVLHGDHLVVVPGHRSVVYARQLRTVSTTPVGQKRPRTQAASRKRASDPNSGTVKLLPHRRRCTGRHILVKRDLGPCTWCLLSRARTNGVDSAADVRMTPYGCDRCDVSLCPSCVADWHSAPDE